MYYCTGLPPVGGALDAADEAARAAVAAAGPAATGPFQAVFSMLNGQQQALAAALAVCPCGLAVGTGTGDVVLLDMTSKG